MRTGTVTQRRFPASRTLCVLLVAALPICPALRAQTASAATLPGSPIAIVPIDASNRDEAAVVTGALEVTAGKAIIAASGSVTSGSRTTEVVLPRRGTLSVCASTTVKLAADTSVPASGAPGLLMAMDHGAVEMSFANTPDRNADVLMTPDFRILIGSPGASDVKVRLGREGDTCIDNSGKDAPYVIVSSIFDSGLYRVQPGQRVMFQHGSLREVVDEEKEPCGCPPPPEKTDGNDFPLAQSEGLAPLSPLAPVPTSANQNSAASQVPTLVYSGGQQQAPTSAPAATSEQTPAPAPAQPKPAKKNPNVFVRFGHFLSRIFGAE
jgi:hypothetical protein